MTGELPLPEPDSSDEHTDHDAEPQPTQSPDDDRWPEVLRMARPLSMTNPAIGDHTAGGHDGDVRPFPHRAYERLAGYCAGTQWRPQPQQGPQTPRVGPAGCGPAGRWHPSQGRPDVCPRCDARRSCCHCQSNLDDLRLFARRMAELHQPTGTPVCGCGAHNCYVRRRLDAIGRQARP
jgi:hypothetical protein